MDTHTNAPHLFICWLFLSLARLFPVLSGARHLCIIGGNHNGSTYRGFAFPALAFSRFSLRMASFRGVLQKGDAQPKSAFMWHGSLRLQK